MSCGYDDPVSGPTDGIRNDLLSMYKVGDRVMVVKFTSEWPLSDRYLNNTESTVYNVDTDGSIAIKIPGRWDWAAIMAVRFIDRKDYDTFMSSRQDGKLYVGDHVVLDATTDDDLLEIVGKLGTVNWAFSTRDFVQVAYEGLGKYKVPIKDLRLVPQEFPAATVEVKTEQAAPAFHLPRRPALGDCGDPPEITLAL